MHFGQISDLIGICPLESHFHCYASLDALWSNIGPYSHLSIGIHLSLLCPFRCLLVKYRTLFAYAHWNPSFTVMSVWIHIYPLDFSQISHFIGICPLESHFHCYVHLDAFWSNIGPYSHMSIGIPLSLLCPFRCILVKYMTLFAYVHWNPSFTVMSV